MAVGHAAAELGDQLARRDPCRRELDARLLHPARDRIAAQALAAVAPLRGEPLRSLLDDVAHPVEGLDVVDQGRPAEQADLSGIGRPVPRQAALALDALEHRGLLAADVGAGTPAQHEIAGQGEPRRLDFGDLAQQHLPDARVLVAQIDVGRLGLDRPGRDQHPLEEAVRVALEIVAILEGAGLALVGVDREIARLRLLPDELPLASGRKAGAAEAAQPPSPRIATSRLEAVACRRGRARSRR